MFFFYFVKKKIYLKYHNIVQVHFVVQDVVFGPVKSVQL